MNDYDIVQLNESNLHHLYALYKNVYNKVVKPYYFHLKYNTAYTGAIYVGFIAFSGKLPVAYYGVIPMRLSVNRETVLAAQSCDTMTHPDFRGKGLFTELAQRTFQLAIEKGIHFVFGFPNQNSYPGFINKLDFSHAQTLQRYTIPFKNSFFKKVKRKLFPVSLQEEKTTIINHLLQEGFDGVIYDEAYLNYKKYNSNVISAHPFAWLNMSDGAWIGVPGTINVTAVNGLIDLADTKFNVASVTFMVSPQTGLSETLSEIKKPEEGFAVITKNLSGIYNLDNLKFQFADIDIF